MSFLSFVGNFNMKAKIEKDKNAISKNWASRALQVNSIQKKIKLWRFISNFDMKGTNKKGKN